MTMTDVPKREKEPSIYNDHRFDKIENILNELVGKSESIFYNLETKLNSLLGDAPDETGRESCAYSDDWLNKVQCKLDDIFENLEKIENEVNRL